MWAHLKFRCENVISHFRHQHQDRFNMFHGIYTQITRESQYLEVSRLPDVNTHAGSMDETHNKQDCFLFQGS